MRDTFHVNTISLYLWIFYVALLLLHHCNSVMGAVNKTLLEHVFWDFDKDLRPNHGGPPVLLEVDLYVESFGNIAEADMEYTVFGYFRHTWFDKRFTNKSHEVIIFKGATVEHAWLPDTYISNSRQSNLRVKDSESDSCLHIYPSGDVFYSKGVMIVASCDMLLEDFPMDTQQCSLNFGSYAHSIKDIIYKWKNNYVTIERRNMAQFYMTNVWLYSHFKQYVYGNYSQLSVSFSFERRVGYYVIQAYLPDSIVVAISWIVFWLDQDDMGGRVGLGISSILTIMFLLGAVNTSLPRVSYPKAIDWYLIVSFCFVFFVLVECIIVYVLGRSRRTQTKSEPEKGLEFKESSDREEHMVFQDSENRPQNMIQLLHKRPLNSVLGHKSTNSEPAIAPRSRGRDLSTLSVDNLKERIIGGSMEKSVSKEVKEDRGKSHDITAIIDRSSRCLFPFIFVMFNIFYWFYFLRKQSDRSQLN